MAISLDNESEPIAAINVTPFVDIILVVLIIFMVTAPMIMKPSINVDLPQAISGDSTLPSSLQITIKSDGTIEVNGKPSDLGGLEVTAIESFNKQPDIQAVIAADRAVQHGTVVGVIDILKKSGIKKFGISIDRPVEK